MRLHGFLPALSSEQAINGAIGAIRHRGELDIVAPDGVRPGIVAELSQQRPIIVVTATGRTADDYATALADFLDPDEIAVFPAWETLPHERLSPRSDTVAKRLAVLRRLAHPTESGPTGPIKVLLVPARSLLQPIVKGLGDIEPVTVRPGDTVDLEDLTRRLADAAYTRVDMVERRGEMAVRGGILDVFPPTLDHPLRIELWGDEVDEIRSFAVADQRSLEPVPEGMWAPPCRELILTESVRERAAALADEIPQAADMLTRISEGIAVEGMESLSAALADGMVQLLDLVDPESLVIIDEPERVRRRAHDLVATTDEFLAAAWISAAAGAKTPVDLSAASFHTLADTHAHSSHLGLGWWSLSSFGANTADDDVTTLTVDAQAMSTYRGDVTQALDDLHARQRDGWRVVLLTPGHGSAQRLVSQLGELDAPARFVEELSDPPSDEVITVTCGQQIAGFFSPSSKLFVLTEADITGRSGTTTKDMRRMPSRRRNMVDPLQLRTGDFVVHEQHGVGRFIELVKRKAGAGVGAATREFMVIEYAPSKRGHPGDRLFVPTDNLDQVSKYVGGESPAVNKMGGSDWAKTKGKARKAVREIAGELIRLYAARMATTGHAFSPDTPWQRELEDAFAHVETPDQLATIDEVKADMEKSVPMDRLICGDVGYGKTEIAVRAAFKAVQDGKQVAILVPTTLLVQQHLDTFKERYAPFPVTVKPLSRFQTDAEAKATITGAKDGSIDVLIGTHRLLTGEVRFKDLGLVIIDEEQRFGVEHKEVLKQLRTNVDVLAMSATPIPRTLEMAVTGIREMSTLATPPEERHPVLTYVGPQEDRQVAAAIRRELLREGQVFYVHNRVESINRTAAHLAELVPEARIAVAHGQMNEHQLEQVITDFWERRFDVLVSTTIVETGLDISNANTLILERADRFGLSQLHQLRGRVGRGRERAYAYFLYPTEKPLTETAHDRLRTIAANTDLGSGMQVAMKDLEIRGAGNLLGGEQSGHIAGVGFDLYIRMVGEAVADFNGEGDSEPAEVRIELPVDAHIPHDWIEHERLRLEAYRKIAASADDVTLSEVDAELRDRYGELPEPAQALFAIAKLRNLAREVGLTELAMQGKYVRLAPVELPDSKQVRLGRLYPGSIVKLATRTILIPQPTTARVGGQPLRGTAAIEWAHTLITTMFLTS